MKHRLDSPLPIWDDPWGKSKKSPKKSPKKRLLKPETVFFIAIALQILGALLGLTFTILLIIVIIKVLF